MIFLNIFLSTICFLWSYTITINVNVCNAIEMYSSMFCIRCTTFVFFMKTINMFSYVSVYVLYLLYIIFVHIQNLFHLIDGRFLWCAHAFKSCSSEYFTVLIYTNITIPWLFLLFRCSQSLFFTLNIIRTWRLFIFIRTCSSFVVAFWFLLLYCFVGVSNFFVGSCNFLLMSDITKLDQTCFPFSLAV